MTTIRRASPSDAGALVELAESVGREEGRWILGTGPWRPVADERRYLRTIQGYPDAAVYVAEDGDRLRSSRQDLCSTQRTHKRVTTAPGLLDDCDERARADASQQDAELELVASKRICKGNGVGIGVERHLTHRRCRNGLATVRGDDGRHLLRTAAFKT